MPDDTTLGYDGNPNSVVNGNTDGETLIYNVAQGSTFLQSNGKWWFKKTLPNTWIEIGGATSVATNVVTRTISSGATEQFYSLDLNNNENFEFIVDTLYDGSKSLSRHSALYNDSAMTSNEYSFLGEMFDMDISITASGTDCLVEITNNESSDMVCSVKAEAFNEL
jgi:hypothetical protein